jgi:hypothetical protein
VAISAAIMAAERQQKAEDNFLLADTSGDGFVDEEELLELCTKLLSKASRALRPSSCVLCVCVRACACVSAPTGGPWTHPRKAESPRHSHLRTAPL